MSEAEEAQERRQGLRRKVAKLLALTGVIGFLIAVFQFVFSDPVSSPWFRSIGDLLASLPEQAWEGLLALRADLPAWATVLVLLLWGVTFRKIIRATDAQDDPKVVVLMLLTGLLGLSFGWFLDPSLPFGYLAALLILGLVGTAASALGGILR